MRNAAVVLSFLIGAMSIVAGGKAMQGWNPGWSVLAWLPVYNFVMGLFTVAVPALWIWKNHPSAMTAALVTLFIHGAVLVLLLAMFRDVAATQSIFAMLSRFVTWLVIVALLYVSNK